MEKKYDEMTESEEEREVAKLSKKEQKQHQGNERFNDCQGTLKDMFQGLEQE